ncbi:MAG: TIGR03016 family PEP-CTERM system-associated outer membrane protein [Burkholderiales bacterium]|nr:TIGR03016 family PEP-CTERM system-associated outer membrane protein [Burkholderiales bacterium]
MAVPAWAQEGPPPARSLNVNSSASLAETFTDNRRLDVAAQRSSDTISQATAAVGISSRAGRLIGSLDYSLTGYVSARDSSTNRLQNTLNANGTGELWNNHLFIDMGATISEQSISALGVQAADPALDNPNRTEVRTLRVAPRLQGRIVDVADLAASIGRTVVHNDSANIGNSSVTDASLTANSNRGSRLGWNAALSSSRRDFEGGRSTEEDSFTVGAVYLAQSDLKLSANVGKESTDVSTPTKQTTTRWGGGLDWFPTERTKLSASYNHRYFGAGHNLLFEHRFARSVIRLTSTRDVNNGNSQGRAGTSGTAFDLFNSIFTSFEPDPVKRAALVNTFLLNNGINPNQVISTGFLSSAATLQQRDELSYAVQLVRSSAALSFSRTSNHRLDPLSSAGDDLSRGGDINQRAVTFTLGHRLTPLTGISLDLSRQWSESTAAANLDTQLRTSRLTLSTSFGLRTSGSLAYRHVVFLSPTRPYHENALTATLGLRF